ncbi:MAG TPA: helix-turn-helix domain-containing protein [Spirochaetia bacterium]|nr:helix-turn-helix domain-containing protein [Spirochaetia bacterium]
MYKFLMVDDEEIVRRGFRRKIDWTTLGFEFLQPCENGEQAIEAIETLHPDVVMTDIYMPRVDGLAVAAYAAEHHPEIVIVILSGYDEFEYAQKAIRSSVFEYLLKPVTSRDLAALLVRLTARLDADRISRQEEDTLKERATAASALLKTRSLLDLVSGVPGALTVQGFQDLFGFSPAGLACAAVIAEAASAAGGERSAGLSGIVAAAAESSHRVLLFSPGEGREAMLVFDQDLPSCERLAAALGGRIASAGSFFPIVGIGRPRESWIEAPRTYAEAAAALLCRLASGPGKAFRYAQASEDDPAVLAELKSRSELLCRATVSGETEEAESRTTAFFTLLEETRLPPQRIRHEIGALFESILDALRELGVSAAAISRDLGVDYELAVQRLRTSEDVKAYLLRLAAYAGSVLESRNLPVPQWKARDFKEYIARHYGEQNLSVQKVAASLSISASYLSKLVKRHLDRSVVDYLIDYRMERAKELLATSDLMTYEIAEATGYTDSRYFSSTFKRHIGVTPTEFREAHRRKTAHP